MLLRIFTREQWRTIVLTTHKYEKCGQHIIVLSCFYQQRNTVALFCLQSIPENKRERQNPEMPYRSEGMLYLKAWGT